MTTMTFALFPEHDALITRLVESGRYSHANDVVIHALALLEDREIVRDHRLARLNGIIEEGLEDVREGRVRDADEVFSELYRSIDNRRALTDAAE
jgi:putative addiction module CopG family antidote